MAKTVAPTRATEGAAEATYPPRGRQLRPSTDLVEYAKQYARQKPDVAALWCFGLGFIVGWKLKPW